MSKLFDSKYYNDEAFAKYIETIPNVKKLALVNSGVLASSENVRSSLANQGGSFHTEVPYSGRISAETSQNNDGATDIQASALKTYKQGHGVASRMDAFVERDFTIDITSGYKPLDQVANQLAAYKADVRQRMILAILKGIYSMSDTEGAKFVNDHTLDTTSSSGVAVEALNNAMQKACGDNKNNFKMVIMDSTVATDLENQKLLNYAKYTDINGIERELVIPYWNGRMVLVDDDMPTENIYTKTTDTAIDPNKTYYTKSGDVYTPVENPSTSDLDDYYEVTGLKHTTYILGAGSIMVDPLACEKPIELYREPMVKGGQENLIVRDRYACGVQGISLKSIANSVSYTNDNLGTGSNWEIVNNGNGVYIPSKSIHIARLITKS